ncbi:MAG: HAD-IB family hydrolase [Anaerolineae bacterium]|nr:HAD-IB family hydrolase [Anaerolineae bacterium]
MSYVVFSDVGGTVIDGTPWDVIRRHPSYNKSRGRLELLKFLPVYGLSKIKLLNESRMRKQWLARMAASFTGFSRQTISQIYQDSIEGDLQGILRRDVVARLQEHKQQGATVILVSGIFTDLVQMLAEHIGIDGAIGTQVEYQDDIATGQLFGEPCVGIKKIDYIQDYMKANHPHINMQDCYGYADSFSDKALLSAVGRGIATYPDDAMRGVAENNGWEMFPA